MSSDPPFESRLLRCVDPDCPVAWAYRDPPREHWHPRPHGPDEPPTDSTWTEYDRVQWLRDHLSPDAADALAGLIADTPPCPRCGVPMEPTDERAARWYCRPCVVLVVPMGPVTWGSGRAIRAGDDD